MRLYSSCIVHVARHACILREGRPQTVPKEARDVSGSFLGQMIIADKGIESPLFVGKIVVMVV